MDKVRAVLVDLNGTLHIGDAMVGQAASSVERLRQAGIPVRFVSNTSKQSKAALLQRVRGLGLDVPPDQLFTSLTAVRARVDDLKVNPLLLLSDSAKTDFHSDDSRPHDAVVVGLAPEAMNYAQLDQAFHVLRQGGCLLAAHKGRYLAKAPGELSIGPGAFVAALEYAAGVEAQILGKPCKSFFLKAIESFGLPDLSPHEVAMVGDDVLDDAVAAKDLGLLGVLVRTGKYAPGDEDRGPTLTLDSFDAFVDALLAARTEAAK